jgi:predicted peroxiredoxin
MGVMTVEGSDPIDGSDIAGAPAFLDYAVEADVSLFV